MELVKWLDRSLAVAEGLLGILATAILIGIILLVSSDAILRYMFNSPLTWGVEVSEYALVYITFLAAAWGVSRGAHINVDAFVIMMPEGLQRACQFLCDLIALAVCTVLTWSGVLVTLSAFERAQFRPTPLQPPVWIILAVVPVGAAVLVLRFLRDSLVSGEALLAGRPIVRREHGPTIE